MWSETAIFEGAPPASGWAHGVGNFSEQNWGDSPERHHYQPPRVRNEVDPTDAWEQALPVPEHDEGYDDRRTDPF